MQNGKIVLTTRQEQEIVERQEGPEEENTRSFRQKRLVQPQGTINIQR